MSSRRSQRMRRRFMPWYQAIVRSTTHLTMSKPEPCGSPRRTIRADSPGTQAPAVFVVVVCPVGVDRARPSSGTAASAAHVRHRVQQRFQPDDVVAVAAGQQNRERDAAAGQDVVLGARSGAVDRARTTLGHDVQPSHARNRPPHGPSPAHRRSAARTRGSRAAAANTSYPSRSPAPVAGTPTGYRCAAPTGSLVGTAGRATSCGLGCGSCAGPRATTARSAPTDHPGRSTAATHPSSWPNTIYNGHDRRTMLIIC